ncbi:MAG: hypothetical protein ACI4TF_14820 [Oliverpabstia sp.]
MEFSADIEGKLCVALVEGSDDVSFVKENFSEYVICKESVSGKIGLEELLNQIDFETERVIAIRDRDYADVRAFPERMFAYDYCCLELMLVANKNVSDGFFRSYYNGSETKENFVISAMRILAPYSILRRKNEIEAKGINFESKGRFGHLIDKNGQVDWTGVFDKLSQTTGELNVCCAEAERLPECDLWDITNGHDLCLYLGKMSKTGKGKTSFGEEGIRKFLLGCYRKDDFQKTKLYQSLKEYQAEYEFKYVD